MVSEEEVALRRFCEDSSNSNIRKGTVPLISSWSLGRHGGTLKIVSEASEISSRSNTSLIAHDFTVEGYKNLELISGTN